MNPISQVGGPDCERFAEAIGALADQPTGIVTSRHLDDHLTDCEPCRRLLADLRQIQTLARTLESREPPAHVWHTLRHRVAADADAANGADTLWWQRWHSPLRGAALAASVAVVVIVSAIAISDRATAPTLPVDAAGATGSRASREPVPVDVLDGVERPYVDAINELERLVSAEQTIATPVTAVLTRNLGIIDGAIADSRAALSTAPDSVVARSRLRAGLRQKVTLLETAVLTSRRLSGATP
jgi:hypothetical protein